MKRLLIGSIVAGFVMASLTTLAQEQAAAPAAEKAPAVKEQPAMPAMPLPAGELTLAGKLSKKESIKGDVKIEVKEGAQKEVVKEKGSETITWQYILTTADDTEIVLPEPKAKAGAETITLEKFVGKDVTVVAKGHAKMVEGKKHIKISKILKIEEVAAAAK